MEQFHLHGSHSQSHSDWAQTSPLPSQTPNSWGRSPFVLAGGPEDLPPRRQHLEELLQVAEEHQREGRLAPPAPRRGRAAHQVCRAGNGAGAATPHLQQLGQPGNTWELWDLPVPACTPRCAVRSGGDSSWKEGAGVGCSLGSLPAQSIPWLCGLRSQVHTWTQLPLRFPSQVFPWPCCRAPEGLDPPRINSDFPLRGWAWQRSLWEAPDLPRSWQESLPWPSLCTLQSKPGLRLPGCFV